MTETEPLTKRILKKKWVIIPAFFTAIVVLILIGGPILNATRTQASELDSITCGPIAEPYEIITLRDAKSLDGRKLTIVKAVIGNGQGSVQTPTGMFPTCGPLLDPFSEEADLIVQLEESDTYIYVLTGIIGWLDPPLAEPQP